jgi:hypothetical protein
VTFPVVEVLGEPCRSRRWRNPHSRKVIGYHADRGLYRVVYIGAIAERNPSAVQKWRLFSHSARREDALEAAV